MNIMAKLSVLSVFIVTLFSCMYEDIGNYDYQDINDVNISGIETEEWYVKVGFTDTLRISPELTFAQDAEEKNYRYEWKAVVNEYKGKEFIIGHEKDLDYPVSLQANEYVCYYKVMDTIRELTWTQKFFLRVNTVASEGWVILCDENGTSRMDIIAPVDEYTNKVGLNIFEQGKMVGVPLRLGCTCFEGKSEFYLFAENGSYALDAKSLAASEEGNMKYQFGIVPAKAEIRAIDLTYTRTWEENLYVVVDKDGNIYNRYPRQIFALPQNRISGETKDFKAAPYIGLRRAQTVETKENIVLYDETNRRFLQIRDGSVVPAVMQFENTDLWPSAVTGKDMICMENTSAYTLALLKDPGNHKVWLYGIELAANGVNKQKYFSEVRGPGIENATVFAFHRLYSYLFYAVGNEVYRYDYIQQEPAERVCYFPDEEVVSLKSAVYQAWSTKYEDWEKERQYDLVVGSNHLKKDKQKCGVVRMYKVPDLRGELTLKYKPYEGLGNIVDIIYKERR